MTLFHTLSSSSVILLSIFIHFDPFVSVCMCFRPALRILFHLHLFFLDFFHLYQFSSILCLWIFIHLSRLIDLLIKFSFIVHFFIHFHPFSSFGTPFTNFRKCVCWFFHRRFSRVHLLEWEIPRNRQLEFQTKKGESLHFDSSFI